MALHFSACCGMRHVRNGCHVCPASQTNSKFRFQCWLIKTRKCTPGIRGLELCCSNVSANVQNMFLNSNMITEILLKNIMVKKIVLYNTFFLRPRSWSCFYKILLDYPQELIQNQSKSYIDFLSWFLCLIWWYKTPGRCRTHNQELRSHTAYSHCCLVLRPKLWN